MRVCSNPVRAAALFAVLFAGCSGSTSSNGSPSGPGAFAGVWRCVNTGQSGSASAATMEIVDNGDGTIAIVSQPDAAPPCSVNFAVTGSTATIVANQTCTGSGAQAYTMTYAAGSLMVSGNTLNASLTVSVVVTAFDPPVTATQSAQRTCTRQ